MEMQEVWVSFSDDVCMHVATPLHLILESCSLLCMIDVHHSVLYSLRRMGPVSVANCEQVSFAQVSHEEMDESQRNDGIRHFIP